MDERQTTLRVYWEDLRWLQERQRRVSFRENKTITMPELIHDFVRAIKEWEAGADPAYDPWAEEDESDG